MSLNGTALHARLDAARQLSGASVNELWWDYFSLGGRLSLTDLTRYLDGEGTVGLDDPDVVAHALNERFAGRGEDHPVPYLAEEPGTPSTTVDDARLAAGTVEFPGRLLRAASRAEPDRLATLVGE